MSWRSSSAETALSTLKRFGYPPGLELLAAENILKQAELLADEFTPK